VDWPVEVGESQISEREDLALEACGVTKPAQVKFDGLSLVPLLKDEQATWPDRNLYFQWHRGDTPQIYRAFAVRSEKYKLVQANGADGLEMSQPFKLFDMRSDPLEFKNVADDHPDIVEAMREAYERWFKDVTGGRNYSDPSRIHVGAPDENPTILTWHDSRGGDSIGRYFDVQVDRAGLYNIVLRYPVTSMPGAAHFAVQTVRATQKVKELRGAYFLRLFIWTRGRRDSTWVSTKAER
jgi:N-sulphoglucosamine sulphohydrolase, C-terminal